MKLIIRRRQQRTAPARAEFLATHFTSPHEHYLEAERLTWVIDDVIQSPAKRTLGDLIALARLHLELARNGEHNP